MFSARCLKSFNPLFLRSFSSLPKSMRAVEITKVGGPEVLKLAERPVPTPKPHEVLIKVAAAGINRPDVMQRIGMYPPPQGASDIPGLEVAGEVVACGDQVSMYKIGDKVCGILNGGGYAEYATNPERQTLPVPKGMDMIHAAGICESFFTVYSNICTTGHLKKGESFLVHGGTSAHAMGCKVYTTVSGEDQIEFVKTIGADVAIDYMKEDFYDVIRIDVILDYIGGDYANKNIKLLRLDGRMIVIGFLKGPKVNISLNPILLKRLVITGSTLRSRTPENKAQISQDMLKDVWPLIENGQIKPIIYKTLPLEQACEAHKIMESNKHIGKLILTL
ncbi:hypothetical protein WA158_002331 [Blastocystis sp. Blastoise]